MVYRAIGVMSGSSLDGLDIAFAEFQENAGQWTYSLKTADCYPYSPEWLQRLKSATSSSALEYQLLHSDFGRYIGQQVNKFMGEHELHYQVALITSHGHTTFHSPPRMTGQIGDGAGIAAETQLPVVTDLRAMDLAFGGQGAPIVPIGEKLLLGDYDFFLNIGGIANISFNAEKYIAFDVCPANRILNMLANESGKEYDEGGKIAASGKIDPILLEKLNALDYYRKLYPKSLANDFGTGVVFPLIQDSRYRMQKAGLPGDRVRQGAAVAQASAKAGMQDAIRTYTEHICIQIKNAIGILIDHAQHPGGKLLVTGGGAFNTFLTGRLEQLLKEFDIELIIPDEKLVKFKEALIMAFIGVLRWREEYNVLSSVTGASRNSIGGAVWLGQEA
jgi:anhydro-N-acetylmuramic acid kinase